MARTKQVVRKAPPNRNTSSSGQQLALRPTARNAIPTKRTAASTGKVNKPKRRNRVEREIRTLQNGTGLIIPKRPFQNLCREISQQTKTDLRFQKAFFEALQVAAEAYIVGILDAAYQIAKHSKRVTLMPKDIRLLMKIHDDLGLS